MFRDLIIRMKTSGKENEGILIDKIWRFLLEIIDDYIQQIQENIWKSELATKNSLKAQEEIEKIKNFCQKKVNKLEKGIERVKLDYVLAKDPRKLIENQKIKTIGPRIEKIKGFIDNISELQDLARKNIETRRKSLSEIEDVTGQNSVFKEKRKKSLELSIFHFDNQLSLDKISNPQ